MRLLSDFVRLVDAVEDLAKSLKFIASQIALNAAAQGAMIAEAPTPDDLEVYQGPTDADLENEANRRAAWEHKTGKRLLPWEDPPEDFVATDDDSTQETLEVR